MSQCSKEDGRSSSGPPHETAAPKRTYDMMEGRVSRAIASASIEGGLPAQLPAPVHTSARGPGTCPGGSPRTGLYRAKREFVLVPPGERWWDGQPYFTDRRTEAGFS